MGAAHHADKELTKDQNGAFRLERMQRALSRAFSPHVLTIDDESSRHAGHAGAHPGGETHFRVRLVSDAFTGLSRVARQRLVNDLLKEEFATGLHALTLELKTPDEI
jgi:BolA family transcriptional regulator, general stress-responsive regulator